MYCNTKIMLKMNVFMLLIFVFSANNTFSSEGVIIHDITRRFDTIHYCRDLKCNIKKIDLSVDDFSLRIKNNAYSCFFIVNKKNVREEYHAEEEYLVEEEYHVNALGDYKNNNGTEYEIKKCQLHKMDHFFTEDMLSRDHAFSKKGDVLISEEFILKFCHIKSKDQAKFEYQVILNSINPKPTKKSVDDKYLFILKNSYGEIIKRKTFNGAEFIIELFTKGKLVKCMNFICCCCVVSSDCPWQGIFSRRSWGCY